MTQTDPLPEDGIPDDDVIAAELALGVLEGAELASARERQIASPDFARRVARWRDHFAVLALDGAEIAPPEALADRVLAAVKADRPAVVPIKPERRALQRWRTAAWASGAIAAGLAAVLIMRPATSPVPTANGPTLVAALDVPESHRTVLASLDGQRRLRLAGQLEVPGGRDAQLWLIVGKAPPRSLGVMETGPDRQLRITQALSPEVMPGVVLAISIEPLGGSPTGLPTGPVVASGTVQAI